MKLSKELEKEVRKEYLEYWDCYMKGDSRKISRFLDSNIKMMGTTEGEVFNNKKEAVNFFKTTAGEVAGKIAMRNRIIDIVPLQDLILINEQMDLYVLSNGEWVFYSKVRLSSLMQQQKKGWKIIQQHGSMPDTRTEEGETIAFERITKENLQLRDAVKRRTTELEQKNRELEIETALEKVRTVAMGMKVPADMLEICRIIAGQLEILKIKDIRNVQTAIFYESKGIYLNYEFFSLHDKAIITRIEYNLQPDVKAFVNQMLTDPEAFFTASFKGKKLKEWLDYQQNSNQFVDPHLFEVNSVHYYFYSIGPGALGISTYSPLAEEDLKIFKRFRNVFELAYRRFIDIERAEAQAKEAQIETALEKVRARVMSMHKSEELIEVCKALMCELQSLGFQNVRNTQVALANDDKGSYMSYDYYANGKFFVGELFYNSHPFIKSLAVKMRQNKAAFINISVAGAELDEWRNHLKSLDPRPAPKLDAATSLHYYYYSIGPGGLGFCSYSALNEDDMLVLKRFKTVFDQTYTRFLDLQKAEAQARESQIEAALERVRARTMGMHNSNDLLLVINVVSEQLQQLGFYADAVSFITDGTEEGYNMWLSSPGDSFLSKMYVPRINDKTTRLYNEAKELGKNFYTYTLTKEEKDFYFKNFFENTVLKNYPDPEKQKVFDAPGMATTNVILEKIVLSVSNFSAIPYNEEDNVVIKRFAFVFQQSYTRFLDLQKAEAQAREAKIEAALERVRARALAMHKSEELKEVALELRNQMGLIGQKDLEVCAIHLYEEDEKYFESWFAIRPPGDEQKLYQGHSRFPKKGIKIVDEMMGRYYEGSKDYVIINEGEKAVEWFGILRENEPEAYALISQSFGSTPLDQLKAYWAIADFSGGSLVMVTYSGADETSRNLLRRSANVFEMAYTRFLDLKKAEAQAREAKIEAALEKVRAKVMAMNSSKDLNDTSLVFGEELRKLGIDWQFSYFWLIETDKDENTFWITWPDNKTSTTTYSLAEADESFRECILAWQRQDKIHASFIAPETVVEWLNTFERITADAGGAALKIMQPGNFKDGVYYYDAMIRFGSFGILTNRPINEEEKNIQSRFAVEFERAYTRFLDLQKAEAQAREARIEAALERVRSRTMAMQHSDELKDAANLLFRQVKELGIHAWSAGYGTWMDGYKACTLYMSSEDQMQSPFIYPHTEDPASIRFAEGAEKGLALYVEEMGGEALASHYRYMRSLPLVGEMLEEIRKAGFNVPQFQVFHVAYYSHGYLLFITYEPVPEAHVIFKRFGNVFEQTYTRFLDLQQKEEQAMRLRDEKMKLEQTLGALQATQKQLIQAEKMASLGELTAGIAHEIQNPLNFVTNFSEVSNELIQEMVEEVEKGNYKEAKELAEDVKQNLGKINYHGKRADGIVKGMLQHSRNSSGAKEPTDINALADEYLRLCYHGLRAKDKTFNAKLESDFDATIEKINVMPQDLGRVILNLINNAFYAVDEKKKKTENGYEPTVSINTKKQDNKIEIKVRDNGNGIPQKLMDKIFQPFFTTKPTGQGTGLGLSLAYDIIKAHGGEIKVETKEGEGTEFIISLPVNQ